MEYSKEQKKKFLCGVVLKINDIDYYECWLMLFPFARIGLFFICYANEKINACFMKFG